MCDVNSRQRRLTLWRAKQFAASPRAHREKSSNQKRECSRLRDRTVRQPRPRTSATVTEIGPPEIVVCLVDHGVVIAVGSEIALTPERVVGCIDDAVLVVVARRNSYDTERDVVAIVNSFNTQSAVLRRQRKRTDLPREKRRAKRRA